MEQNNKKWKISNLFEVMRSHSKNVWSYFNFPMVMLLISQFLVAYFSSARKYNVNLLFGKDKWYRFDLMFKYIKIKQSKYWLTFFFLLMFVFYILDIVSQACVEFFRERLKLKIASDFDYREFSEVDQWIIKYSKTMSDFISLFASVFFSLILEIWSVIRVNLTRNITARIVLNFATCLFLLGIFNMLLRLLTKRIIKFASNLKNKDNFAFYLASSLQKSYFFDMGNLFLILLFIIIPNINKESNREVILAILFSYNVSSIITRSRKLIKILPETKSNYKIWLKTKKIS